MPLINNPWRKAWLRLSMPAMAEQGVITVCAVVLMMLYGKVSVQTLAAVGAGNLIFMLLQSVFQMLSTGVFVVVARFCGQDDQAQARQAIAGALTVTVVGSLLVSLLFFLLAGPVISLCVGHADAELHRQSVLYLRLVLVILPFSCVNLVADNALRGCGDMKTPLRVATGVNLLNIALTFLFICGPFGLPQLGVLGIGLAICVIRVVEGMAKLVLFFNGRNPLGLRYRPAKPRPDLLRRMLTIGLPATLEMVIMQAGLLVAQRFLAELGAVALSAYQVANSIISLVFQPFSGIGMAAGALAGRSIGAVEMKQARFYGRDPLRLSAIAAGVCCVVLYFAYPALAHLYTGDPALIQATLDLRIWFVLTAWLIALANVGAWTIKGAGDTRTMFFISNIGLFAVRVVGYGVAALWFSQYGILLIGIFTLLDFVVRTGLVVLRVWRNKWMYIRV